MANPTNPEQEKLNVPQAEGAGMEKPIDTSEAVADFKEGAESQTNETVDQMRERFAANNPTNQEQEEAQVIELEMRKKVEEAVGEIEVPVSREDMEDRLQQVKELEAEAQSAGDEQKALQLMNERVKLEQELGFDDTALRMHEEQMEAEHGGENSIDTTEFKKEMPEAGGSLENTLRQNVTVLNHLYERLKAAQEQGNTDKETELTMQIARLEQQNKDLQAQLEGRVAPEAPAEAAPEVEDELAQTTENLATAEHTDAMIGMAEQAQRDAEEGRVHEAVRKVVKTVAEAPAEIENAEPENENVVSILQAQLYDALAAKDASPELLDKFSENMAVRTPLDNVEEMFYRQFQSEVEERVRKIKSGETAPEESSPETSPEEASAEADEEVAPDATEDTAPETEPETEPETAPETSPETPEEAEETSTEAEEAAPEVDAGHENPEGEVEGAAETEANAETAPKEPEDEDPLVENHTTEEAMPGFAAGYRAELGQKLEKPKGKFRQALEGLFHRTKFAIVDRFRIWNSQRRIDKRSATAEGQREDLNDIMREIAQLEVEEQHGETPRARSKARQKIEKLKTEQLFLQADLENTQDKKALIIDKRNGIAERYSAKVEQLVAPHKRAFERLKAERAGLDTEIENITQVMDMHKEDVANISEKLNNLNLDDASRMEIERVIATAEREISDLQDKVNMRILQRRQLDKKMTPLKKKLNRWDAEKQSADMVLEREGDFQNVGDRYQASGPQFRYDVATGQVVEVNQEAQTAQENVEEAPSEEGTAPKPGYENAAVDLETGYVVGVDAEKAKAATAESDADIEMKAEKEVGDARFESVSMSVRELEQRMNDTFRSEYPIQRAEFIKAVGGDIAYNNAETQLGIKEAYAIMRKYNADLVNNPNFSSMAWEVDLGQNLRTVWTHAKVNRAA